MDDRIKNTLKIYDDNFNKLVEKDAEARKQKTLVGRYIAEQFADGYAYYTIVKENKKTVKMKVVTKLGDDWVIPSWGETPTLDKRYVMSKINFRDRHSDMWFG
jgi:hypothetical protein